MSPGMCGTMLAQHQLISLLNYLNMKVMSNPKVAIPSAMNMIKDGKVDFKMSSGFILNQINSFIDFIEKNNKNI
jgi:chromate reductase